MRILIALVVGLLGPSAALILTTGFSWPVQMVAAAVGCMFSWPAAAAISGLARFQRRQVSPERSSADEWVMSPRAVSENYWRDRGHPPFMRPPQAPPDHHQFDPDRLS